MGTGSVQKITTSSFASSFNIMKPDKREQAIELQSDDMLLTDFFTIFGGTREVTAQQYSYFVEDKIIRNITSNATVTQNTADTAATITLSAADHSADGKYSYPQLGMGYRTTTGKQLLVTAKNTSVDGAHTITVIPKTGTAVGVIAAGEKLACLGVFVPMGSGSVQPYQGTFTEFTNQLTIKRETARIQGSSIRDGLWIKFSDPTGMGEGSELLVKELIDSEKRFKNGLEATLMISEYDDNVNAAWAGLGTYADTTIHMTRGLLPGIETQGGMVLEYAPGEPNIQFMRKWQNKLDGNYGDKENLYFMGRQLRFAHTDFITDIMRNGAIQYGAFEGKKEIALKLGFDSIYLDGYTWHFRDYELFNNPDQLNSPGFDFGKRGFSIPVKPLRAVGADGSIIKGKPMNVAYKPIKGQMARTIALDGLRTLENPTTGNDVSSFDHIAEWGFEQLGIFKFSSIRPASA